MGIKGESLDGENTSDLFFIKGDEVEDDHLDILDYFQQNFLNVRIPIPYVDLLSSNHIYFSVSELQLQELNFLF